MPGALQKAYGDLASTGSLEEALAGNAQGTAYRDYAKAFIGFKDTSLAAHGGDVTVESTEGEGSPFRLRVPLPSSKKLSEAS